MPGRTDDERHTAAAAAARRRRGTTHMCRVRPGPVVNRPVRSPLRPSVRPSALRASHVLLCPSSVAVGRRRCYSSTWPTRWTTMTTVGLGGERPSERRAAGERPRPATTNRPTATDRPTDRPTEEKEGRRQKVGLRSPLMAFLGRISPALSQCLNLGRTRTQYFNRRPALRYQFLLASEATKVNGSYFFLLLLVNVCEW